MTVQIHPSTALVPPHHDEAVSIDNGMVDLVRAIWARGWQTAACCQDTGEAVEGERDHGDTTRDATGNVGFIEYYRGWSWLKMPRDDAFAFLGEMAEDEGFRDLVTIPWGKGSWRLHTPVVWSGDRFVSTPFVQIYFPKQQLADILKVLE
ncbi:hypothetical protein [Actinomadura sp. WAC 06369]|uniref:hypothetical protein n=1 Tax=Actinomadura sp. WAC 06369 TaxID=2203193 RepID=UPI000F767C88|nr:hypothetical protein [Actinomadura sp. WAC 06369]RSN46886.1 hypothetical protein DMH08_34930 [Actinomadura sp. WAC 06369]